MTSPPGAYITLEPLPTPGKWRAVLCLASGAVWTTGLLYAGIEDVRDYAREWAERSGLEFRE